MRYSVFVLCGSVVVTILLVWWLQLIHEYVVVVEREDEGPPPVVTRQRRLGFVEPLPTARGESQHDSNAVTTTSAPGTAPVRTRAGTLIPLVVHVWAGAQWESVARAWQAQGWTVRRWPLPQDATEWWWWPYFLVWEYGGLFTLLPPHPTRSLRHYLVYRGFDTTVLFFQKGESSRRAWPEDFAAQAQHPVLQALWSGEGQGQVVQPRLLSDDTSVTVLDAHVFFSDETV